jgi:two-component system sensor histidine kinase KdpD
LNDIAVHWRSEVRAALPWILIVGMVTAALVGLREQLDKAHVALAYLLVVLFGSARRGRNVGLVLAVLCFLCFNFFQLTPFYTFRLTDAWDLLILLSFLATGTVAAQLLHRVQREANLARQRAAEIERLSKEADRVEAMREADRLKDALLASVSHDLRTPLTTIRALAHEMRCGGDERAAIIEQEADRLNRLVADLLDLSRLNAGAMPVRVEINAADDLLASALDRITGVPGADRVDAHIHEDEPLFAQFDFTHALRALVNLIENAIKYSPVDSRVEVSAARDGDLIVFSVLDRGPGIPADRVASIFEPFARAHDAMEAVAGAGLGLAIARRLTDMQGGQLTYTPRPGGGSMFTLRFARVDADLAAHPFAGP